jgi:hypothetical protein
LHWGGHSFSQKGLGPKAVEGHARGTWLPRLFWETNDVFRYTTKELFEIATQCASDEEVVGAILVPGDREVAPSSSQAALFGTVIHGVEKGAKGGKKR